MATKATAVSELLPLAIKIAQVVGLTSSAVLCGLIGSCSYLCIPVISLAPPGLRAQQWVKVYEIGSATAPPIAISAAVCFGFLAAQASRVPKLLQGTSLDPSTPFYLYTAAALIVPTIVPWTILVMKPTNDALFAKAKAASVAVKEGIAGANDDDVGVLIRKWSGLNYVRAAIVGVGTVLATVATVGSPDLGGMVMWSA